MSTPAPYTALRPGRSQFVILRGLNHHVTSWGDASLVTPRRPPLVMLHGWMDVGVSFQFMVDALPTERYIVTFDWRGFGRTQASGLDTYWFPDYLADLDAFLDRLLPGQQIDLLGHSMGGNVGMLYAGVRPERIRRLINLEGFGAPETRAELAPTRYAQWLDELKQPADLRPYDDLEAVAARLRKTNPLLPADRAAWLARHWSRQRPGTDGQPGVWDILGDPVHTRATPLGYQVADVQACWRRITAPMMWVEGDQTNLRRWWGMRYTKEDFHARLNEVPSVEKHVLSPAGHMVHHDQPEALARLVEAFLAA